MDSSYAFCTVGMFIIDEIDYIHGKGSEKSIIGGAGTYAALGARLAAGAKNAARVAWIVDQGDDFPPELRVLIEKWGTSCHFRTDLSRRTTRAWNRYSENEHRAFGYLTPKLRLEAHDLSDDQVLASSFHMVCSSERCITLVERIRARRSTLRPGFPDPIFVWEPVPDSCTPDEIENLRKAARYVDVVSPNQEELSQFFSEALGKIDRMSMIESVLIKAGGIHGPVSMIVRDGADGCRLYIEGNALHLRAYHQDGTEVVDPTGGGNTFVGALAIGLTRVVTPGERCRRHILAAIHATIGASFAIEQVGTPSLTSDKTDCWNGISYQDRFANYVDRERSYIINQLDQNADS